MTRWLQDQRDSARENADGEEAHSGRPSFHSSMKGGSW